MVSTTTSIILIFFLKSFYGPVIPILLSLGQIKRVSTPRNRQSAHVKHLYKAQRMETLPPPGENRGPLLLRVTWIAVGISTVFTAARIFTRIETSGKLQLDDYLMLLALVIQARIRSLACSLGLTRE